MSQLQSPFTPNIHRKTGFKTHWGRLYGSAAALALCNAARLENAPVVALTMDTPGATRLEYECRFFGAGTETLPLLSFPDWETLPYDGFSPHQDIISDRLATLYRLPQLQQGILIVPISTLMHRLPPRAFLDAHYFVMDVGDDIDLEALRQRLTQAGYRVVSQVMEHGEFAVRGSIVDLFPMGGSQPYRIELFDREIESIRTFDAEDQRSLEKVQRIRLLPAREFPFTDDSIKTFRENYRQSFEGDPQNSRIYHDVSNGITPSGIEYYLPLFFQNTAVLFDYLPENTIIAGFGDYQGAAELFWREVNTRYDQYQYNSERPPLPPRQGFLPVNELYENINRFPIVTLQSFKHEDKPDNYNFSSIKPQSLNIDSRAANPTEKLELFLNSYDGQVLFAAESTGRRESLADLLKERGIKTTVVDSWQQFLQSGTSPAITVAALQQGLQLEDPHLVVIAEAQLYGEQVLQQRRRRAKQRDPDLVIRNLVELEPGSPVVHEDHGVGRYQGLQVLQVGATEQEFLTLEYAGKDKLYVPVASLHLISRYTGASPETAPLHKLGSPHWEKVKRKAREKARDVAAELLDIYARREARKGYSYQLDKEGYQTFSRAFPFEETPDQEDAITGVIQDMRSDKPMDRLVCGDVGFGKTEVAMRAAFVAVQDGKQVAMLVPTTLLAQQHYENFQDRFADWPVKIQSLSRFRSKKEQDEILKGLESGTVDIIIGTHKLIQDTVKFKRLGLVIIDEEHRFGVRQKEQFKKLRSEVDLLTLTATPIPRTLNMSLSGLRDLSIIATAPAKRMAVKTFTSQWNDTQIQEACMREIRRGGQVFFLHNQVETIEKMAAQIAALLPEAKVEIAHGQMRERELERVMADFYHQRFSILVCTTIIETGIDVPNANTIIINRADRFGLAQLYQLRGRVGRSHHQAYAYLITPPPKSMTADAVKRLEAIESIEDLGAGFTLATHDLEIRGAGELLGEDQSGQMHEIGFDMYMDLLERAVKAMKSGKQPELDQPLDHGAEVDLGISALIPDDYLPDVHSRLIMYKRIANAADQAELRELQVEMIDRFGLLPENTKNLFSITELKLLATPLGIKKLELGSEGGRIVFNTKPNIDPMNIIKLIQTQYNTYKLEGQDKLRIVKKLEDPAQRRQFAEQCLGLLQG
ncbi:MAG: transcription-repair coupling factor [Gammaproteobacteria bacterium]|nr:transcription-repair coupling factor [Gammaproteobacteria bacterium]MDH5800190.1 transcription-repair coupling factor [Gammaproteobacteria bacterium]